MTCKNSTYQYQVGGSLPENAPSYVTRAADDAFYRGLKSGEFCYVLNCRQMGKSSLRVRTMQRLQADGIACAVIDITQIGSAETTVIEWYAGIINIIADALKLPDFDLNEWWQSCGLISPVHHLSKFIEDVLLKKVSQHIVIFIDESDAIDRFGEDFFALVRSFYEKRPNQPEFNRLSFGILGVASPEDLIRDKKHTPFNVGKAIDLRGFQGDEVQPLAEGLRGNTQEPEGVLLEILNWTGGQPFLTQKICDLMCSSGRSEVRGERSEGLSSDPEPRTPNPADIAALIRAEIIDNWESKDEPPHFKHIRDRILQEGGQRTGRLLGMYRSILENGSIPADDSREQMELCLSGLVVKQENCLRVYNRIYAEIFDLTWTDRTLKNLRPYAESLNAWKLSEYKDESRLLSGQALEEAVKWAEGKSLSDEDHRFLSASREAEQKAVENALEAQMQANQLLAQKRRNRMLAGFLAIALMLGGLAGWQWQQVRMHQKQALTALERAEQQKELALEAVNILTYNLVDELAKIPRTANIITGILKANVAVLDKIYALEPDTRKAMREKGSNLSRLGDIWLKLGNTAEAVKAYQQDLEISKKLAENDPDSGQAQRDLSVSYNKLGDVYLQTGNTAEAVRAYQQSMEIRKKLAENDPDSSEVQRDLSVSFEKLGDVYLQSGNTAEAVKAYQQSMEISKKLAENDPDSGQAQRDLSVSYNKLGNVYLQTGSTAEAVRAYQQSLEISKKLAENDPDSGQAQRDLSVSYNKLGDVYLQTGSTAEAVRAYQQSLEISKKLAENDPDSGQAQRDLLVSHYKLGTVHEALKDPKAALQAYQAALAIARILAKDTLNQQAQNDLRILSDKVKELSRKR